jgi:hypothetical protein
VSVTDAAEDLRDRVHAAQNIDPLQPNETAGITETWPETERQKVLADWRITERVDFDKIDSGVDWPIVPVPTVLSISPASGVVSGGESVTITGTLFAAGATVTIGGAAATSVVVVSDTEITCETPSGTAGNVDVVVTVNGVDATLTNGFEYVDPGAAPEWITADQKSQGSGGGSGVFNIDAPDNISAGDILVFIRSTPNETGNLQVSGTAPAGFTLQATGANLPVSSGFDVMMEIYTKIATGSEPSSYSYESSGSEQRHVALIGRVENATTVGASAGDYYGSEWNPDAPSVTVNTAPALLICAAADRGTDVMAAPPTGMTTVLASSPGSFESLNVAVEEISATGATGARTFSLGSGEKAVVSLVLEP